MNNTNPILEAYLEFADYLLRTTFRDYEHAIRALIGKEEVTPNFIAKHGNPVIEKLAIENWITNIYSNFDSLSMGYSRDSARKKIEVIQRRYGCSYGNMSDKITERMNQKIEKIFKKH